MCEGASKQTPDLKILPRPPHFEIPGSATEIHMINCKDGFKGELQYVVH